MVHLIHREQVPLLHNAVLILWYEGDGLVGMIEMFFGHPQIMFCFRIKKNNFQPLLSRATSALFIFLENW